MRIRNAFEEFALSQAIFKLELSSECKAVDFTRTKILIDKCSHTCYNIIYT